MSATYMSREGVLTISMLHKAKTFLIVILLIATIVIITMEFLKNLNEPKCSAKKRKMMIYGILDIVLFFILVRVAKTHLPNPFRPKSSNFTGKALVQNINDSTYISDALTIESMQTNYV